MLASRKHDRRSTPESRTAALSSVELLAELCLQVVENQAGTGRTEAQEPGLVAHLGGATFLDGIHARPQRSGDHGCLTGIGWFPVAGVEDSITLGFGDGFRADLDCEFVDILNGRAGESDVLQDDTDEGQVAVEAQLAGHEADQGDGR